ncbi:MAG: hypothetical protein IPO44_08830 [Candidatus Microthrix sp.]|nr:hypothetical protein [Candidatus Microthrix sp.]MBK9559646.1 hypothetical protein [Candidatus Microthrix sp.]
MALLLDLVRRPDLDEWNQLAMSGIGGSRRRAHEYPLAPGDGEEFLRRAAWGRRW